VIQPLCLSFYPLLSINRYYESFKYLPIITPQQRSSALHVSVAQWWGSFNRAHSLFALALRSTNQFTVNLSNLGGQELMTSSHLKFLPYSHDLYSISLELLDPLQLINAISFTACSLIQSSLYPIEQGLTQTDFVSSFVHKSLTKGIQPHITLGFFSSFDYNNCIGLQDRFFPKQPVKLCDLYLSTLDALCMVPVSQMLLLTDSLNVY